MSDDQEPVTGEKIYLQETRADPPKLRKISVKETFPEKIHPTYKLDSISKHAKNRNAEWTYTVKSGDTWTSVARIFKIHEDSLQKSNPGVVCEPGVKLVIPEKQHLVSQGETVFGISKKYEIPMDELVKRNKILQNKLYPGQVLIIPNLIIFPSGNLTDKP